MTGQYVVHSTERQIGEAELAELKQAFENADNAEPKLNVIEVQGNVWKRVEGKGWLKDNGKPAQPAVTSPYI